MNTAGQSHRPQTQLPIAAGLVAVFITAGLVSWATPDGNLVVTLVPALVVGLLVFGAALWLLRRNQSE